MIDNNPWKSIRSLAKGMKVYCLADSAWRLSTFLIQDEKGSIFIKGRPRYKAFEQTHGFLPNDQALTFLRWENFCKDQIVNSNNNCWLVLSPQIWIKIKNIIVFWVVISDSDVILPCIFLYGLKLNKNADIKSLEKVVLTWIETVIAGRSFVGQQDSSPCQISRRTQFWLSGNFCNHITPNI